MIISYLIAEPVIVEGRSETAASTFYSKKMTTILLLKAIEY